MHAPEPRHRLFLQWLIFFSTVIVGLVFIWLQGGFHFVIASDSTHITLFIALIFVISFGHGALRAWRVSCELNDLQALETKQGNVAPQSIVGAYLKHQSLEQEEQGPVRLDDVLSERMRGPQEIGWFLSGLLVKLGLLGTVIGFIYMLGSVADLESLDISDAQELIQRMTKGMGVALVTTLVGLVASMISGFQYLMIDRGADRLISGAYLLASEQRRVGVRK
ncbi:MAG: MotA/TolQ/ExbB proton channel family protein [Rhodospirillales bacterium]|nr:MotA/TolQ/ExbB proton channel family protein [Rhodospirillales bacterium]